jgi:hypothetical protein
MDDATVQHRTLLLKEIIQDLNSTISLLQEADNPGKQRTTSGDQGDRNRYGDN